MNLTSRKNVGECSINFSGTATKHRLAGQFTTGRSRIITGGPRRKWIALSAAAAAAFLETIASLGKRMKLRLTIAAQSRF